MMPRAVVALRRAVPEAWWSALLLLSAFAAVSAQSVNFTQYPIPTPNSTPQYITKGPDGAIWFTETNGNNVGRITTDGVISEYAIPTPNAQPNGITTGPDGALWFTELNGNKIGRITTGGAITEFPELRQISLLGGVSGVLPDSITAGPDGALWFTEFAGAIGRITTAGAVTEYPTADSAAFITAGADGALWFTQKGHSSIYRITTSGTISEYPVPSNNGSATGITSGPDGALWFGVNSGAIGRITTSGTITEFPTPSSSQGPFGITSGPDGALWYTDFGSNIWRISTSGAVTQFALASNPATVAITDGPDDALWFTDQGNNLIWRAGLSTTPVPSQGFMQQGSKLVGSGAVGAAEQGSSLALSADGNTALVGGLQDNNDAGAVWVFIRDAKGNWTQQGSKLVGSGAINSAPYGALQGVSVALSSDGNTALVGGQGDNKIGAVWVFTRDATGNWSQQGSKLVGSGYSNTLSPFGQGHSVALSSDGNTALVGDPGDSNTGGNYGIGAVWVFTRDAQGHWSQQGNKLVGSGAAGAPGQGVSVALSSDGNTALVGGQDDNNDAGAVWVFIRDTSGNWTQQGNKLVGTGAIGVARQGSSVALSGDGNTAIIGGPYDNGGYPSAQGAAWVFTRNGSGNWIQQGTKLVGTGAAGSAGQGSSVALSSAGNTALVGGSGDNSGVGAVWTFARDNNGNWSQEGGKLVGSGAAGLAFQGDPVAISADGNTFLESGSGDNNLMGAVWVFARSAVTTGQPLATSVGNGASFAQSFAPGMLMSVFGTGLSNGSPQTVTTTPLPLTSSSGTSVTINEIPAPLLYISATQINLQIPYEASPGTATLTVNAGGQSASTTFTVQSAGPGIFVDSRNGHVVPDESASAGSTIEFFLTGAGQVTPSEATGNVPVEGTTPVPDLPLKMTVGGVAVTPVYVGIPSWSVGVLQINFTVPSTLAAGTYPVVVTIGSVSSQAALLTITTP